MHAQPNVSLLPLLCTSIRFALRCVHTTTNTMCRAVYKHPFCIASRTHYRKYSICQHCTLVNTNNTPPADMVDQLTHTLTPAPTEGKRKHKSKAALLAAAHAAAQTTSNPHTTSLHTTSPHTTSPHPPPAPADATEAREEAWRAALMRARGEKVLDDPRLLRKSLKREAKAKQKSKQAWQQRKQKQSDEQAARQQR